jgi:peptidase A4-like protein
MQNTRQRRPWQSLTAMRRASPYKQLAPALRGLAIAAMVCLGTLPGRSVAQPPVPATTWQCCWAGYVLYPQGQVPLVPPSNPFTIIEGEWVVPNAAPTIDCSDLSEQTDGSSIWVALDGWSDTFRDPNGTADTDILQAGTETDVPCWATDPPTGPQPATAYFWIEWDGLANIPVAPGKQTVPVPIGDTVHVRISVDTTTWQQATVFFEDKTPGGQINQTYTTTFPSGCLAPYYCGPKNGVRYATLFGNSAEWIVETTFYATQQQPNLPNTLDNFGTVQMTKMSVTDINGNVYSPDSSLNAKQEIDWMSWTGNGDITATGNALLACAAVTAPHSMTLSRAPYTITYPGGQGRLEPKPQNCDGTPPP